MKDNFQQRKTSILTKLDKSSIGCWDKPIVKLCNQINKLENYYTTSSCSGRIVLMLDKEKKGKDLFIKVYHSPKKFNYFLNDLNEIKIHEPVKFKQEPPILHVACKTLEDAESLLKKAQLNGWKKSGLISIKGNIILELNSTERIEFPIFSENKILVNEPFLKEVLEKGNKNLKKGWLKIQKLEQALKS